MGYGIPFEEYMQIDENGSLDFCTVVHIVGSLPDISPYIMLLRKLLLYPDGANLCFSFVLSSPPILDMLLPLAGMSPQCI